MIVDGLADFDSLFGFSERRLHHNQDIDITAWTRFARRVRSEQNGPVWLKSFYNLPHHIVHTRLEGLCDGVTLELGGEVDTGAWWYVADLNGFDGQATTRNIVQTASPTPDAAARRRCNQQVRGAGDALQRETQLPLAAYSDRKHAHMAQV